MKILAIETTSEICSVALWKDGEIYTLSKESYRNHAKYILPLIKIILEKSSTILTELDVIAFSRGPGSFTGIRIGIGVTQGLAFGLSIPTIGISTMAIIAQGVWRNIGATQVLVVINARMGEVYWAEYIRDKQGIWHGEDTEKILKFKMVKEMLKQYSDKWTIASIGWSSIINEKKILTQQKKNLFPPMAEDILPIAHQFLITGKTTSVEKVKPVYLKNATIWKNPSRSS